MAQTGRGARRYCGASSSRRGTGDGLRVDALPSPDVQGNAGAGTRAAHVAELQRRLFRRASRNAPDVPPSAATPRTRVGVGFLFLGTDNPHGLTGEQDGGSMSRAAFHVGNVDLTSIHVSR